jgi:hypothetical protein
MNTKTPETDAELIQFDDELFVPADFARKLERERDEAQRVIREQHAQIICLYALEAELRNERDRLRKVCDELANATRAEFGELNWRLDAYNQLPHVKKNPDIRKAEPGPARATKP